MSYEETLDPGIQILFFKELSLSFDFTAKILIIFERKKFSVKFFQTFLFFVGGREVESLSSEP